MFEREILTISIDMSKATPVDIATVLHKLANRAEKNDLCGSTILLSNTGTQVGYSIIKKEE